MYSLFQINEGSLEVDSIVQIDSLVKLAGDASVVLDSDSVLNLKHKLEVGEGQILELTGVDNGTLLLGDRINLNG